MAWVVMADAFSPISINGMVLENRFMRSATHDGSADGSGTVTRKSLSIYRSLGAGDIGLIVTGYAYVSVHGQALPNQYGVHTDDMIRGLRKMAEAVHEGGGRIALQIVHAGVNSPYLQGNGAVCLAPSKIEGSQFPQRELSAGEIEAVIQDFGSAAWRAREAGFDAVQLHGAHGYLLSQFLSPLANRRTDSWGGSPENRRRFHVEVIKEVRRRAGRDYPLLIKFGLMDDAPGGVSLSEGIEAAREMVEAGVDAIEVSAGVGGDYLQRTVGRKSTPENEEVYFRQRAAVLKRAVPVPVMVVGGVRSFDMAQAILDAGDADMISMSRPFIREPGLISRWAEGDRAPARCITCNQCGRLLLRGQEVLDNYCWQECRPGLA